MPFASSAYLLAAFVFVVGAATGSFLNVCIYRMPRGLPVNASGSRLRPSCVWKLEFWRNLPLLPWNKRQRAAADGKVLSFRQAGVELLTGLLFLGVWLHVGPHAWALAFAYWILVSLLIVATFIDFEFLIIPDEITWGGVVGGIALSLAIPMLMDTQNRWAAGARSLGGAALGYLLLWATVELGKKAFGKKRFTFDPAKPFTWTRTGDEADLVIDGEKQLWSEFFSRESDRLLMRCAVAEIGLERFEGVSLDFHYDRLQIAERKWTLIEVDSLSGTVTEITIPREAMGFGDVKFIAAIGAFLGWKSVLFTIASASAIGATIGLLAVAFRRKWSEQIPFGPYLSLGALLWLFVGPRLLAWYLAYVRLEN